MNLNADQDTNWQPAKFLSGKLTNDLPQVTTSKLPAGDHLHRLWAEEDRLCRLPTQALAASAGTM